MANDEGSESVVSKLESDVVEVKKGVEMRVAMLEEILNSLQSCHWRDALEVSYPRPSSSAVSITYIKSIFVHEHVVSEILIDNNDESEYTLTVMTSPCSTTKWLLLDENDKPTYILRNTHLSPYRILVSFPRSILFSAEPPTTAIVYLTKMEKNQPINERHLSDAFIREPPKDSLIVQIDTFDSDELSIDWIESTFSSSDHLETNRLLLSLRLVYCTFDLPPIDVYTFASRLENNEFEKKDYGSGQSMFFGQRAFGGIMISTRHDEHIFTSVISTVFCRNHDELQRVIDWLKKICKSEWIE